MDERCDGKIVRPSPWRARSHGVREGGCDDIDFDSAMKATGTKSAAHEPDEFPVHEDQVCVDGCAESWDPEAELRHGLETIGHNELTEHLAAVFRDAASLDDIDTQADQVQEDERAIDDTKEKRHLQKQHTSFSRS